MFTTVPFATAAGLGRSVTDVMHADPVRIDGASPLSTAVSAMAEHRVHAVLVCDPHGTPLGWITTRGMLHNSPRDWSGAIARDAITEELAAVLPTETIGDALNALVGSGSSHLLVQTADGDVLGVVADFDLLGLLAETGADAGVAGA